MKKKMRRLFALALSVCMALVMTTGIAAAGIDVGGKPIKDVEDYYHNGDQEIPSETVIRGTDDRLISIAYYPPYYDIFSDKPSFDTPEAEKTITPTEHVDGYKDNVWNVYFAYFNEEENTYELELMRAPIEYQIQYYDDDKLLTEDTLSVEYDYAFYELSNMGYYVKGWATEPDSEVIKYKPGEEIEGKEIPGIWGGEVLKLYAIWDEQEIMIKYNGNAPEGAAVTGKMEQEQFPAGYERDGALTLNQFKCDGYTFKGWNTAADGSGEAYEDGADINEFSVDFDAVTTIELYAQWEKLSVLPEEESDNPPEEESDNPPEEELDHSPKAGDDMPIGILMTMLLASMAAAAIVGKKRRV